MLMAGSEESIAVISTSTAARNLMIIREISRRTYFDQIESCLFLRVHYYILVDREQVTP